MSTVVVGVSKEHITKTPGVCGGRACIAGRRIRVMDVVTLHQAGWPAERIRDHFDGITLADVYAALAYYHDFPDEVAEEFRQAVEIEERYRPVFEAQRKARAGG